MGFLDIFTGIANAINRSNGDASYNAKTEDLVHPKTVAELASKLPVLIAPQPQPKPAPVAASGPAHPAGVRYGDLFDRCFMHAMNWEAYGGARLFDITSPIVIAGDISTPQGRRMCGYTSPTDQPDDRGGETKFGVAQKAHPELNVRTLTLAQAEKVYYDGYFLPVRGPEMPGLVGPELFDIACGSGPFRARVMLQQALGITADGVLGPMTMAAVAKSDPTALFNKLLDLRRNFYRSIATGSQAKFLKGWLNRANDVVW